MSVLGTFVSIVLLALGLMLAYSGITLLAHHRRTAKIYASVIGGFALAICMAASFPLPSPLGPNGTVWRGSAYAALFGLLGCIAVSYVAFIAASFIYAKLPKRDDPDYIVVLGAGLVGTRVSRLLAWRLDTAVDLWERGGHRAHILVSGARGADESVPEADAMHAYLASRGVPELAIIDEPHARTTEENMRNCKMLMDGLALQGGSRESALLQGGSRESALLQGGKHLRQPYTCMFVTNDFHLLRALAFARRAGLAAQGMASKTTAWYWPGAIAREYVALLWMFAWVPAVFAAACLLAACLLG